MPQIVTTSWEDAREHAAPVRTVVFVQEQGVPAEIELDALDPLSLHALAHDSTGACIATGRLLPSVEENGRRVAHIGRMAVLAVWRRRRVGSAILYALMEAARSRGDQEVVLSAQVQAVGFYEAHGYLVEGTSYFEAGILHQDMRCRLSMP